MYLSIKTYTMIRNLLLAALLVSTTIGFNACKKKDKKEDDIVPVDATSAPGTLMFRTTVWNTHATTPWRIAIDTNSCSLNSVRTIIYVMQVTTDEVKAGVKYSDINWTTIYESNTEMLHADRSFTKELSAGVYKGIRMEQRNRLFWVCAFNGNTYEFPSLNNSNLGDNAIITNIFGENGLYKIDGNGVLEVDNDKEKLGTFEIKSGQTSRVSLRLNITSLDWIDNDHSGTWTDGDELKNWKTPEGIDTMADFIVEYD